MGPSAPDGTFAAGVNRVTELLPSFMTDILTNCPEEQKVRILENMFEAPDQFWSSVLVPALLWLLCCVHIKKKPKTKKPPFSPYLSVCNSILTYIFYKLG